MSGVSPGFIRESELKRGTKMAREAINSLGKGKNLFTGLQQAISATLTVGSAVGAITYTEDDQGYYFQKIKSNAPTVTNIIPVSSPSLQPKTPTSSSRIVPVSPSVIKGPSIGTNPISPINVFAPNTSRAAKAIQEAAAVQLAEEARAAKAKQEAAAVQLAEEAKAAQAIVPYSPSRPTAYSQLVYNSLLKGRNPYSGEGGRRRTAHRNQKRRRASTRKQSRRA